MRRFVTGHDAAGHSIFVIRDEPRAVMLEKAGDLKLTELWETKGMPAELRAPGDAARRERRIEPDANGTVFRIIEYPPDSVRLKALRPEEHFSSMKATAAAAAMRRHPGMHRTKTLDYAIILAGEVYAVLDEDEVLLKAGDVLVQRGTNHAWSNRSDRPCLIAFVLVDAAG
jgi:mannose-6-phosphate isomerase-like protein (cupin superfamily)